MSENIKKDGIGEVAGIPADRELEKKVSAFAFVVSERCGRIYFLLVRDDPGFRNKPKWKFPGGTVNSPQYKDDPLGFAKRKVFTEAGMTPVFLDENPLYIKEQKHAKNWHQFLVFYMMVSPEENPVPGGEVSEAIFMIAKDIFSLIKSGDVLPNHAAAFDEFFQRITDYLAKK